MKKLTIETQIKIYELMLLDYEKQLKNIKENRQKYTASEYRKETGVFYNMIAYTRKQLTMLQTKQ